MTPEQYFTNHSLNPDFLKKVFGVNWDDDKITIPVYGEDGVRLYQRYRHLTGATKFTSDTGAHPALFAVHKIKNCPEVVFCEGEPDCMRLWQESIPAVTGTSGVKTFSAKLAAPLKGKSVLIVLDNDEAGISTIEKYYNDIINAGAYPHIVIFPKEYKDISDYFTASHTKEDFLKLPRLTLEEWQDTNEPEDFAFESDEELLTLPLPPEEWLVDRILPVEGFCFIVGAEATGKSFYTLTLAEAVTTGKAWLDTFTVKKTAKVLFIDKENTKRRTQTRLKGLKMTGKDIWHLKYPYMFELKDEKTESGFSEFALAASRKVKKHGITLIIVDAFTDVMVGNENAASDVQGFFDGFRQLFPGCSILVIHHANKPAAGVNRTTAQMSRGSTNIMAQIYSGFYVKSVLKTKNEFIIEQTKAGDAEKLNKFKVELVAEPNPEDETKTIVTSIHYGGEVQEEADKISAAKEAIEEAFSGEVTMPREDLVSFCGSKGIASATVGRALKEMVEEKVLEVVKTGRKSNYIWQGKE